MKSRAQSDSRFYLRSLTEARQPVEFKSSVHSISMKTPRLTALRALYVFGLAEGTSFLVLLLVGMPLKYLANRPEVVRIFGPIHGGLFLIYVGLVLLNALLSRWKWTRTLAGIVSSVVPLGPFFFDASVKREIKALETSVSRP